MLLEEDLFYESDLYRFSKLKNPHYLDNNFFENSAVPLQNEFIEVIYEEVDWKDFLWGSNILQVKD